jgi:hypothetical protein
MRSLLAFERGELEEVKPRHLLRLYRMERRWAYEAVRDAVLGDPCNLQS